MSWRGTIIIFPDSEREQGREWI